MSHFRHLSLSRLISRMFPAASALLIDCTNADRNEQEMRGFGASF